MKEFMKRLFTLNSRDIYGLVGWFIAGMLLSVLAWPVMVGREVYQWKHYHLERFEWEDVARYTVVIMLGTLVWWAIMKYHVLCI